MPDPTKVDAVLVPVSLKRGGTSALRIRSVYDVVVPLLGVPRPHVREVGGGDYLVTAAPEDTLLFAKDHDHAGEPRYDWSEPDANGVRTGTLRDPEAEAAARQQAREARAPAARPAPAAKAEATP